MYHPSRSQYSSILLLKSHVSTAYSPRMKAGRKVLHPLAIYTLIIIPRRSPEFQKTPGAEFGYQMVNYVPVKAWKLREVKCFVHGHTAAK